MINWFGIYNIGGSYLIVKSNWLYFFSLPFKALICPWIKIVGYGSRSKGVYSIYYVSFVHKTLFEVYSSSITLCLGVWIKFCLVFRVVVLPLECLVLFWKLLQNKIVTRENLFRWRIILYLDGLSCGLSVGCNTPFSLNYLFN